MRHALVRNRTPHISSEPCTIYGAATLDHSGFTERVLLWHPRIWLRTFGAQSPSQQMCPIINFRSVILCRPASFQSTMALGFLRRMQNYRFDLILPLRLGTIGQMASSQMSAPFIPRGKTPFVARSGALFFILVSRQALSNPAGVSPAICPSNILAATARLGSKQKMTVCVSDKNICITFRARWRDFIFQLNKSELDKNVDGVCSVRACQI